MAFAALELDAEAQHSQNTCLQHYQAWKGKYYHPTIHFARELSLNEKPQYSYMYLRIFSCKMSNEVSNISG